MDYGRQKKTVEPRKKVSHPAETREHDKKKDKDKDKEKKKGRRSHSKRSSKHKHKSHSKGRDSKDKRHKAKPGHEERTAGGGHGAHPGQHAGGHSHVSKTHPLQPAKSPVPAAGHKSAHVKEKDPAAKPKGSLKNENAEIPAQENKTTTEKPKISEPQTNDSSPCICCPCLDVPLTWWVLILTIVAIVLYLPGIGYGVYVIALDEVQLYKLWISFGSPNCDPHGRCVNVLGYLNVHNPKAIGNIWLTLDFTFKTYIGLAVIMVIVNAALIASIVFNQVNAFVCFIHPIVLIIVVILAISAMIVFQVNSISGVFIEGIAPLWFLNGLYETWIAVCWVFLYRHVQNGTQIGLVAHSIVPVPTPVPEEVKTKSRHRTRVKEGADDPSTPDPAVGHSKAQKIQGGAHASKQPLAPHPHKEQHHPPTAKHHVSRPTTHHKVAPHPVAAHHHSHKEVAHPHKEAGHPHKEAAHPHKETAHPHKEAVHPHKEAAHAHHRAHRGSHHAHKEVPASPPLAIKDKEKEAPEPRKESENEHKKSSQAEPVEEKAKTETQQEQQQEQRTSDVPHQEEKEPLGGLQDNPAQDGGQQKDQQTPRQSGEDPPGIQTGGLEANAVPSQEVVPQQQQQNLQGHEQRDEQDTRGSAQEHTPAPQAVASNAEITARDDQQVAASSAHAGLSISQTADAELTPAEKKLMELIAERSKKKGRVSVHRRREHHHSHHRGRSSDARGRRRSSEGHRKRDRRK